MTRVSAQARRRAVLWACTALAASAAAALAAINTRTSTARATTDAPPVWTAFTVDVVSAASDQLEAVQIAPGPVLIHAVIVSNAKVALMDGPGRTANGVRPSAGDTLARVVNATGDRATTDRVELDIVSENGLWLAWNAEHPDAVITVLYAAP